jgi:hypothetical protein
LQCNSNFYLYKGECHKACPRGTIQNEHNKLCFAKGECLLENCIKCGLEESVCHRCIPGYFIDMHGHCVKTCPHGSIADKEKDICVKFGGNITNYNIFQKKLIIGRSQAGKAARTNVEEG